MLGEFLTRRKNMFNLKKNSNKGVNMKILNINLFVGEKRFLKILSKNLLKVFFILVALNLFFTFAEQKSVEEKVNLYQSNQMVIEMKGLVCSFCAAKVRRGLKKMLVIEQKNKKSIVVDVENQIALFKIKKGKKINFKKLKKIINKAGYEILKIYFYTDGDIKKDKNSFLVKESKQKIYFQKKSKLKISKENSKKIFLLEMNEKGKIILIKK